jgi:hypothetical protein
MVQAGTWDEARREARRQLPLKTVMSQRGDGPATGGNWNSFKCPFCGHKSAGTFEATGGVTLFKCHHSDCPTGGRALDEAGYPRGADGVRFKTSIIADRGSFLYAKTAEIIRDYLKEVGIAAELKLLDRPSMVDADICQMGF